MQADERGATYFNYTNISVQVQLVSLTHWPFPTGNSIRGLVSLLTGIRTSIFTYQSAHRDQLDQSAHRE